MVRIPALSVYHMVEHERYEQQVQQIAPKVVREPPLHTL